MAKVKLDPAVRKAIRESQKMINELAREDGNEAETRRRVERMFESLMGYDVFAHITREHAVRGSGDTDHCDFAVVLDKNSQVPVIFIELKRVGLNLQQKHLKQAAGYAINAGCEWIILTNSRDWRLYHISFGKPPETQLIESWNLLEDDTAKIAACFEKVGYRSVKRGHLDLLWQKRNVLTARNLLSVILGEDGLKLIRRELKKKTGVAVTYEEVVGAVRRMLNEAALGELGGVRITLPERRTRRKTATKESESTQAANVGEADEPESGGGSSGATG